MVRVTLTLSNQQEKCVTREAHVSYYTSRMLMIVSSNTTTRHVNKLPFVLHHARSLSAQSSPPAVVTAAPCGLSLGAASLPLVARAAREKELGEECTNTEALEYKRDKT